LISVQVDAALHNMKATQLPEAAGATCDYAPHTLSFPLHLHLLLLLLLLLLLSSVVLCSSS
jgi:hypothetical protein